MLGAAAAVWEDLRSNHILAALLDLPTEEECSCDSDDREYDPRMSLCERNCHMEWESSTANVGSAEGQAEGQADGQAAKGHGCEDDRHSPSSESLQQALLSGLQSYDTLSLG